MARGSLPAASLGAGMRGRIPILDFPLVEDDDDDVDGGKIKIPFGDCFNPESVEIVWWYERIGTKHNGIHVNWKNWKKTFDNIKGSSLEVWCYYHEYFHHVVDSWKHNHKLKTPNMDKVRKRIWNQEQSKTSDYPGLLLDEALAEALALSVVKKGEGFSYEHITFGSHPSYDPTLGSWGWLSLSHVYQIINDEYMIFREPMPKKVDDRSFIKGLNTDYEKYENEIFSAKNGFADSKDSFSHCKFQPDNIPFYVHECSEEWYEEVHDFVKRNQFSEPRFIGHSKQ